MGSWRITFKVIVGYITEVGAAAVPSLDVRSHATVRQKSVAGDGEISTGPHIVLRSDTRETRRRSTDCT